MIPQNLILSFNFSKLYLLDKESLFDKKVLSKLGKMLEDPLFDYEPGKAREFLEKLTELSAGSDLIVDSDEKGENILNLIILKLSWKAFICLPSKQRLDLTAHHIVWALDSGISVKKIFEKYFSSFESRFVPDKESRRGFIQALEANQEKIGDSQIKMSGGEAVPPLVKSWLKAYNADQPLNIPRGKFNEINFINKNKNVFILTPPEKFALEQILELYDWLLFPVAEAEVLPEGVSAPSKIAGKPLSVPLSTPYLTTQKFELPKEVLHSGNLVTEATRPLDPQVLPSIASVNEAGGEKLERKNSVEELIKKNLAKPAAVNFPAVSAVRTEKKYQKPVVVPRTETEKKQPGSDIDLGQVDMSKVIDARILKLKSKSNKNDEQKSN